MVAGKQVLAGYRIEWEDMAWKCPEHARKMMV